MVILFSLNKKKICIKLEKKIFCLFFHNNQNLRFRIQNYAMTHLKSSTIRQRMETRHFIFIGVRERVISKVNNISILTFSVDVKKRYIKKKIIRKNLLIKVYTTKMVQLYMV